MAEFLPATRRRSLVALLLLIIHILFVKYLHGLHFIALYESSYFENTITFILILYGVFSPLASFFYKFVLSKDESAVREGKTNPMRFFIWPDFWPSDWKR
jgi:hypothetical protein